MTGAQFLKSARLDKGLTTREAAKRIGVTQDILLRAENGSMPRPSAALKIASFYETSVTAIWPVEEVAA